jgi:hypothetical protein
MSFTTTASPERKLFLIKREDLYRKLLWRALDELRRIDNITRHGGGPVPNLQLIAELEKHLEKKS